MSSFKPAGYNSVSPYIIVDGAEKVLNFIAEVFGGVPTRRFNRPDGSIMHAEIKLDDSIIMVSEASEQYPQNNTLLHVYLPDSVDVYKRAVAYGCQGLGEPKQAEGDPDRRGMFTDFAGNVWAVSTQER